MKKIVVAVGLVLGFSGIANAGTWYPNWFDKRPLGLHRNLKPRPGTAPPAGNRVNSNGNDSGGNNSDGNSGASSSGVSNPGGSNSTAVTGKFSVDDLWTSLAGGGGSTGSGQKSHGRIPAPEIDPASGVSALSLLSAALLMIRGRRKKLGPDLSTR